MGLKDTASLALIPAAYKTSKIYSAIPTDGDGDFTFTRSGNATRINKAGLVETMGTNIGRLNYDLTNGTPASCPSLLLEPQRTNNILQSNDPSGANWTDPLSRWTLLTDTTTAPDGGTVRIIELTESGGSLIRLTGFSIAAATYTVSFYIKDIDGNLTGGNVDIGDEGSGAPSPAFGDVGSDWVRATRTITTTGTKTHIDLQPTFSGSTNKVAIWGVQLEAGSYATSLIPTSGSAVTRTVDFCFINSGLQNVLNTSEGTLFVDVEVPRVSTSGSYERIALTDQTSATDRILIDNFGGNWRALTLSSAGTEAVTVRSTQANTRIKIAFAYSSSQIRVSYDGNDATTTSISYTPSTTLESFKFSNKDGGNKWQGKIYQAIYFDTALTNAELKQLTS
jgi:hypothetical protein